MGLITDFSLIHFGVSQTATYLDGFDKAWLTLGENPLAGRVLRPGRREIRSWPCGSHRIYYEVRGSTLWVIRIVHMAMDQDKAMRASLKAR